MYYAVFHIILLSEKDCLDFDSVLLFVCVCVVVCVCVCVCARVRACVRVCVIHIFCNVN